MNQKHSRNFLCAIAGALPQVALGMSVTLSPSTPSPAPLGTVVTWTATISDSTSGAPWYRFRVWRAGEETRTVKDYGPSASFDWTASDYEGVFGKSRLCAAGRSAGDRSFRMRDLYTP